MESKCNALAAISDVRDFCHFTWQHGRTLTRLHVDGGQTIEDWDFGAFVSALPESDRRPLLDSLSQSLKSGQDFENMLHLRDTCLDDKSFLVKCRPSGDDAIQCALMNVSLLWAREEQTQILLDEFAHRIKNNMTVVQSIARRTLNEARTVKEAAEIFDGRLSALALTHDLLVRQNWCGAALQEVVSLAIMPFDRKPSPFRVSGGAIILPSRLTKAMALTIHELCTNAVKYGALSTPKGWIEITWHIQMHAGCEHLFFSWQEMNGPQIEVPPRSKGFGTRIIADWLSREAAGQGQLDYRPEGLRFHLYAPYPWKALSV